MAQFFQIHPDNPQQRLIKQTVDILNKGGLIVYPTDSSYAIGCHIGDKKAMDRIRQLRRLDDKHNFTLVCSDLSEIANYAKVHNEDYRLMKSLTPGAYTFILPATKQVPRRLMKPKGKTIGVRIPDSNIVQDMLAALGEPIMSSTLILPGETDPMTDPYEICDFIGNQVDLVIDGGYCGFESTTVLALDGDEPEILRRGMGKLDFLENQ